MPDTHITKQDDKQLSLTLAVQHCQTRISAPDAVVKIAESFYNYLTKEPSNGTKRQSSSSTIRSIKEQG